MSCASFLVGCFLFIIFNQILFVCTLNYHNSNTISSQEATDPPTGEGDLQLAQSLVKEFHTSRVVSWILKQQDHHLSEDVIYLCLKIGMPWGLQHESDNFEPIVI